MKANVQREKAINYSLKITLSIILLLGAYYGLQLVILKGNLFQIKPVLMTLFYLNCVIVGVKIFKK